MAELVGVVREALALRQCDRPHEDFDVGDLVACCPSLGDFDRAAVVRFLQDHMSALGIKPAVLGVGRWLFGVYVEPRRRSIGGGRDG